MLDAYRQIDDIPMLQVLDALGLKYAREGSGYTILEDGKPTRWKVNVEGNYVHDFSHDRSKGGPRAFVKHLKKFSSKETFDWFETHFGITGDYKTPRVSRAQKLYKPKITYTQPF